MSSSSFSGVVINQNAPQADPVNDWVQFGVNDSGLFPSPTLFPSPALFASPGGGYYQTFQLPSDYPRGSVIPDLTGFAIFLAIPTGQQAAVGLTWELDVELAGVWTRLASGTRSEVLFDGLSWCNVYFPEPVVVEASWLTATFRLVLGDAGTFAAGFTVPNPLTSGQLFFSTTDFPVLNEGATVALMFRLLGAVADSGTDFLGNTYRSAVRRSSVANVSTSNVTTPNTSWLSQPNPSQFAVESIYFDVRANGSPGVIDRVTVDPLTPNVYFHLYYSQDPLGPGIDTPSWENLLWTPVYKTFQAARKATYALPEPIAASYVKVEFTNLQGRFYDPGEFELPTVYKKHPKWVLDYFLARFAAQERNFVSSAATVTYDALDLAFSYYAGDLSQGPNPPVQAAPLTSTQAQFFAQENANQIDPGTMGRIRFAFQPFNNQPALLGRFGSIIGNYAQRTAAPSYTVETIQRAAGDTSIVSNLSREALIVEKGFPVMFFYVPSRHGYRVSQATYDRHTAYFAGVKGITFHRELYGLKADQTQYNEILGDGANIAINDFA